MPKKFSLVILRKKALMSAPTSLSGQVPISCGIIHFPKVFSKRCFLYSGFKTFLSLPVFTFGCHLFVYLTVSWHYFINFEISPLFHLDPLNLDGYDFSPYHINSRPYFHQTNCNMLTNFNQNDHLQKLNII